MRVTEAEIANAVSSTDARTLDALRASHRNVQAFAQASLRKGWSMTNEQGAEVGEVYHPFERVGGHVPGGTAPLVSTAIMTVTFAAAAGCPEIVVCTPCGRDGVVNAGLLAALKIAGATEIYKIGGAQAIAAMAYGTLTIRPGAEDCRPWQQLRRGSQAPGLWRGQHRLAAGTERSGHPGRQDRQPRLHRRRLPSTG